MASRTVKVTIEASVTGAIANLKTFTGAVKEMGSELDRAAAKHPEKLNKIANATGVLGLGAAVALGAITKVAMDFDRQMSAVVAVSDDGTKSLGALRQAALDAGRDTAFTATQAATAEEELAKAGVSTKDILGGGLTGALNLAAAGTLDLGDAATIAAQAMTEFALTGKDVGHIADVLTAGANKSTADVQGLGMALGQVGGVAHQTGLSLEDTVGVLSAFTQAGMTGEEAGTTLKETLLKLQAPSNESAQLMKQLGINIYDAQGHFIGITAVADNLQKSMQGLDEAQRNAALATIFGARAVRGATVLYQDGASGIQSWIDGVNDAGIAAQTAAQKQDNLAGDLHKLLGSLQAVAIQASGGTNAGLRDLAQAGEKALNFFLGLPKPVQEAATVLLAVGAAGLLATSGLLKVKTTVTGAMQALRDLGPAGEKAATGLSAIGSVGSKLGVAGLAIFGIVEAYKALGEWISKKYGPVHQDINQLTTDLREFASSGVPAGALARSYGTDLGKLADAIGKVTSAQAFLAAHPPQVKRGGPFTGSTVDSMSPDARKTFEQAKTNIQDLDKALSDLATNGGAQQAKVAFDKMTDSLLAQGVPMSQIVALFPQYEKSADAAAAASTPAAQGFGNVAANADLMARGMEDAIAHGMTLLDVLKQLNGANIDAAHAEDAYFQAVDDANQKIKDNGKTLDEHTQKGRDNREALLGIAEAANQAAQAIYNQTGSLDQADGVLAEARKAFIGAAIAAGKTKQEAEALADQWLKVPPVVSTQVSAPGLTGTNSQLGRANDELDRLNGRHASVSVDVNVNMSQLNAANNLMNRLGRAGAFAAGGVVEHAAVGKLREAGLYSPASPGRYMIAEPSTGGEAFIPKHGDQGRQRAIADYVVRNWLGGDVSWGGGGGGGVAGGSMTNVTVTVNAGIGTNGVEVGRQIAAQLRPFINATGGGNVQVALGRRGQ